MSTSEKKVNGGRKKVEMVRMEKKSNRLVTFSKRRSGLFKKACELCTLCHAEVAVVVFSPGQRSFSFGHPSVDDVIDRFLARGGDDGGESSSMQQEEGGVNVDKAVQEAKVSEANWELALLKKQYELEKKRNEELGMVKKATGVALLLSPVDEMEAVHLREMVNPMAQLRERIRQWSQLWLQGTTDADGRPLAGLPCTLNQHQPWFGPQPRPMAADGGPGGPEWLLGSASSSTHHQPPMLMAPNVLNPIGYPTLPHPDPMLMAPNMNPIGSSSHDQGSAFMAPNPMGNSSSLEGEGPVVNLVQDPIEMGEKDEPDEMVMISNPANNGSAMAAPASPNLPPLPNSIGGASEPDEPIYIEMDDDDEPPMTFMPNIFESFPPLPLNNGSMDASSSAGGSYPQGGFGSGSSGS